MSKLTAEDKHRATIDAQWIIGAAQNKIIELAWDHYGDERSTISFMDSLDSIDRDLWHKLERSANSLFSGDPLS